MNAFLISLVTGSIGTGYFIYGKKRSSALYMLSGAALCGYPYLVRGLIWLIIVGLLFAILPFIIKS